MPIFTLRPISRETLLPAFDCGDDDLNDFFQEDAINYASAHLAKTFMVLNQHRKMIAYFSLFNDSLRVEEISFTSANQRKAFLKKRGIPYEKRHLKSFGAIKIGRLAVDKNLHNKGIGQEILNYIISIAIECNKSCACKFLIVDAKKKATTFYLKNGFDFLGSLDDIHETRLMWLDLNPFLNSYFKPSEKNYP
ncbi:GNAT family N-acetyltransferase [Danxiaibacter flavus]|uniref:GNAT family N-acetyltransferase n=1 Tax=Danxiaibacter flavus TaxID=3049108 RepID=A0ABV3Z9P6_9BACT|nr:GNAT family N-acetyltransferase [Chitinophagaceae bacterium DXS]